MLVARKGNERKRPNVKFRLLNTRIVRRNTSIPLLRDIFIRLGRAQCEVLSCVDLKEAFHSFPITPEAKEFCGILPYFGSPNFRYEVLLMGLAISSQVWIDYIENILFGMANKKDYIAIMDDLLIHWFKGNHLDRLQALFQAMIKHGLKLSPKKCQLLMNHLLYVVPPQSWGDRSDTKHSKCLLLGGRWLNQLTLIPKPKGSGGARAATAQVGPANKRNDTKRCLPVEASLRPGEAVPW